MHREAAERPERRRRGGNEGALRATLATRLAAELKAREFSRGAEPRGTRSA